MPTILRVFSSANETRIRVQISDPAAGVGQEFFCSIMCPDLPELDGTQVFGVDQKQAAELAANAVLSHAASRSLKVESETGELLELPRPSKDIHPDDGVRGDVGLVVSSIDVDGQIRLTFDDVRRLRDRGAARWEATWFFTSNQYASDAFLDGTLSDQELQSIGSAVVARLIALRKKGAGRGGALA